MGRLGCGKLQPCRPLLSSSLGLRRVMYLSDVRGGIYSTAALSVVRSAKLHTQKHACLFAVHQNLLSRRSFLAPFLAPSVVVLRSLPVVPPLSARQAIPSLPPPSPPPLLTSLPHPCAAPPPSMGRLSTRYRPTRRRRVGPGALRRSRRAVDGWYRCAPRPSFQCRRRRRDGLPGACRGRRPKDGGRPAPGGLQLDGGR